MFQWFWCLLCVFTLRFLSFSIIRNFVLKAGYDIFSKHYLGNRLLFWVFVYLAGVKLCLFVVAVHVRSCNFLWCLLFFLLLFLNFLRDFLNKFWDVHFFPLYFPIIIEESYWSGGKVWQEKKCSVVLKSGLSLLVICAVGLTFIKAFQFFALLPPSWVR